MTHAEHREWPPWETGEPTKEGRYLVAFSPGHIETLRFNGATWATYDPSIIYAWLGPLPDPPPLPEMGGSR